MKSSANGRTSYPAVLKRWCLVQPIHHLTKADDVERDEMILP